MTVRPMFAVLMVLALMAVGCTSSSSGDDSTTTTQAAVTTTTAAPPTTTTVVASTVPSTTLPQQDAVVASFDGTDCVYEGPSELATGKVTLVFDNTNDVASSFSYFRLDEGHTTLEVTEGLASDTSGEAPGWMREVAAMKNIEPGTSVELSRAFSPGVHLLVCGTDKPVGVGGEFVVVP